MNRNKLRGHAYFLEFAGSNTAGGPWLWWLLVLLVAAAGVVELAANVRR